MSFVNSYENVTRAEAYSKLEFANTYHLAFATCRRCLPPTCRDGALDFGCGTGRSTRFLRELGFQPVGVDISAEMITKAHELDPGGDYRLVPTTT